MENNLVLNLNNVDENKIGGFEAMPKGKYECVVEDVELTTSKAGDPMVKWTFQVTHEDYAKRKLFNYNLLTKDFGVAMLKKTILACGVDVDFGNFDVAEFCETGDAIGLPLMVTVGVQNYNGEKRNNVKDVSASDLGGDGFGF